ncbi:MAG: Ig-like domain-containing protein, partial [Pseudomonadota bacterium]|nr:Ig-like domain-containing protein [Pseudomonadota bacterium]
MTIINSSPTSGVLSSRGILRTLILLSLFIFAPILASAATYYVAPSGSNSNPGTEALPFATLQKGHDVAAAGDTIFMRGGTYTFTAMTTFTRDGTSGNLIKVFNYPGETPVIDASNQPTGTFRAGVIAMENASWWHIKGLELKNGPINGIFAGGSSSNNIFENNNIHHMGRLATGGGGKGSGIHVYCQLCSSSVTAHSNLILNNDVHDNDNALDSDGGDANGIQMVTTGTGNVIRGNRAWRNSDDGIDAWTSPAMLIENNWVWENGYTWNGSVLVARGNGNGYKLRGAPEPTGGHTLKKNLAWKNRTIGFHGSGSTVAQTLYNNTAWDNGAGVYYNYGFNNTADVLRNNLSHGKFGSVAGSQPYNSWTISATVNDADFASLDDTCARGPRQANGSLPNCTFLHLALNSDLINKGTNVGLPYSGSGSDLGAFEYGGTGPDSTPPTVSITAPANGGTVSGAAVTVSANASDNVGVAGVQFKLDGVNLGAEDTTSPYSLTWNS